MTTLAEQTARALGGRYHIERTLGRGASAVVFLARDRKHDRLVALKVFEPDIGRSGADRFLQEIRTSARLEHPHILTLIDSGQVDGLLYYVMPFIDGETLRQRLERERQLPLEDVVRIATDVASALAYAHRQGVIHRDIKPENILLQDTSALVADFGIALALQTLESDRLTEAGFSLGTPEYMSPEQAAGDRTIDARTDVYSLGAVVYEMLTGEPPFSGATAAAVIAKLMTEAPVRPRVVRDTVPEAMEAAVMRALAKAPADRFPDVSAFAAVLTESDRATAPARPGGAARGWRRGWRIGALVVGVGLVAAAGWVRVRRMGQSTDPVARQLTFTGDAQAVALSPDGGMVAYLTNRSRTLMVKDVTGTGELRLVESDAPLGPPRWSPGGEELLFGKVDGERYLLEIVSRLGGAPRTVGDLGQALDGLVPRAAYGYAGRDDRFVVSCCGSRVFVSAHPDVPGWRGPEVPETGVIDLRDTIPVIFDLNPSPDGREVAVIGGTRSGDVLVAVVRLDDGELTVLDSDRELLVGGPEVFGALRWWPSGRGLLYARRSGGIANIVSIPLAGGPAPGRTLILPNLPLGVTFDVAPRQGRLVYAGGLRRTELVLIDAATGGAPRPLTHGTWIYARPRFAPDGQRLAFLRSDGERSHIAILDLDSGNERRLTDGEESIGGLSWSPDGRRIAYTVREGDSTFIKVVGTDDDGESVSVIPGATFLMQRPRWSADGDSLLFLREGTGLVMRNVADGTEVPVALPGNAGLREGAPAASVEGAAAIRARGAAGGRPPSVLVGGRERAVFDPDHRQLAVYAGGPGAAGLWILPLAGGALRKLLDGPVYPLRWSRDGSIRFVRGLFHAGAGASIERIGEEGGPVSKELVLPFHCELPNLTVSDDGRRAVCAVAESTSDVWVLDGLLTLRRIH